MIVIVIQFGDEVRTPDAPETLFDVAPLLRLVPEEILALGLLVSGTLGGEDGFEGVGIIASVPGLR